MIIFTATSAPTPSAPVQDPVTAPTDSRDIFGSSFQFPWVDTKTVGRTVPVLVPWS